MDIDLELHRIFREVAKTGSITKAAEKLFVSQSAVSQAVKQLENRIGGKLFNRSVRGVSLTVEGKVLFSHIDDAISLIENAESKFKDMIELKTGSIRIGASDTICNLYLLPILERFNRTHPEILISVTNRTTDESIDLLKHAKTDIAFVNLPFETDDSLEVIPVKEINDCFVVGEKYSFLADREMKLKELQDYPILMLEQASNSRRLMDMFLKDKGVEISPVIELGSLSLLSSFAKIGLGIALTIKEEVEEQLNRNELYQLSFTEQIPTHHIGYVKMKNITSSFAVKAFIDEMNLSNV